MPTPRIIELRDPDGTYVLAQPLSEVSCRVLSSNALARGEVLYKDEEIPWEEAGLDLGGFTRLGPDQLRSPQERPERACEEDRDALAALEDPQYSKNREREDDADPRAALLRLIVHYKEHHERKDAGSRWMNLCRCPQFAPEGGLIQARLHAVVSLALLRRDLPSLPRIRRAIREVSNDRSTGV